MGVRICVILGKLFSNWFRLSSFYVVIFLNGTLGSFINQTNSSTIASPMQNSTNSVKKLAKCRYIYLIKIWFIIVLLIDKLQEKSNGNQYMSEVGSRCTGK